MDCLELALGELFLKVTGELIRINGLCMCHALTLYKDSQEKPD
jgi:hypothetical protein